MTKKKILPVLFLLLVCGCNHYSGRQLRKPNVPTVSSIDTQTSSAQQTQKLILNNEVDYKIYSTIINYMFNIEWQYSGPVAIYSYTIDYQRIDEYGFQEKHISEYFPDLETGVIDDYYLKNSSNFQLKANFSMPESYFMLDEFVELKKLEQIHPNVGGIIYFSRIGFDRTMQKAFASYEYYCGESCQKIYIANLEYLNGEWQIKDVKKIYSE